MFETLTLTDRMLAVAADSGPILFFQALFGTFSLIVLLIIMGMVIASVRWLLIGQRSVNHLTGGLDMMRRVANDLDARHPLRVRIETAPVVEISLEEVAKVMATRESREAVNGLLVLQRRMDWMTRFAQISVQLGILGTIVALISSDPTDLREFRGQLPIALGTTFWGLIGALSLSTVMGYIENEMSRATQNIRRALLDSFDEAHEAGHTQVGAGAGAAALTALEEGEDDLGLVDDALEADDHADEEHGS